MLSEPVALHRPTLRSAGAHGRDVSHILIVLAASSGHGSRAQRHNPARAGGSLIAISAFRPMVRCRGPLEKRPATVYVYSVSPAGRSAARALTPRVLAERLVGNRDAKILLSSWPWPAIRATERQEHRALVVLLAGEL
jgi:hypothetical protein